MTPSNLPTGPSATHPRPRHRGVIEGFYGAPYSHAERLSLIRFLAREGLDVYAHAPKNDPLHRDEWRTPYPADRCREFAELAQLGADLGVRIFAALAPGPTWRESDPADARALEEKLRTLHDCGVGGLALLFDDLVDPSVDAVDPEIQARIAGRAWELTQRLRPSPELWIVGNVYAGEPDDLRAGRGIFAQLYPHPAERYFSAYARHLPPDVALLWTGPGVFAERITASHVAAVREMAGRPIVLWDNFPVNDAFPTSLLLGPYRGREAALAGELHGLVLNLGQQPRASRLPVATAAAWLRDPAGYDPDRAWREAVERVVSPELTEPFRRFAEQMRGHPVLDAAEPAPELGALVAAVGRATPGADGKEPARAELRELLRSLAALPMALDVAAAEPIAESGTSITGRFSLEADDCALLSEIMPWVRRLASLADAALAVLPATGNGDRAERDRLRALADSHGPLEVAATRLPPGLVPFVSGTGRRVDRFAELFAAIGG